MVAREVTATPGRAGTKLAIIDWEAAISALDAGELPSSGGERRVLRLVASLADQAPVSLGEAITGIDARNVGLLVMAVLHASARRQFGWRPPRLPSPDVPGRPGHGSPRRIRGQLNTRRYQYGGPYQVTDEIRRGTG